MNKLKSSSSPNTNDKEQDEEVDMDIYMSIIDILYKDAKNGKDINFKIVNKIYDDIIKDIGKEQAKEILKFNHKTDDTTDTTDTTDTDNDTTTTTTDTDTNTDTVTENIELRGLSFINKQFKTHSNMQLELTALMDSGFQRNVSTLTTPRSIHPISIGSVHVTAYF